jgi:hypothetical protein
VKHEASAYRLVSPTTPYVDGSSWAPAVMAHVSHADVRDACEQHGPQHGTVGGVGDTHTLLFSGVDVVVIADALCGVERSDDGLEEQIVDTCKFLRKTICLPARTAVGHRFIVGCWSLVCIRQFRRSGE